MNTLTEYQKAALDDAKHALAAIAYQSSVHYGNLLRAGIPEKTLQRLGLGRIETTAQKGRQRIQKINP